MLVEEPFPVYFLTHSQLLRVKHCMAEVTTYPQVNTHVGIVIISHNTAHVPVSSESSAVGCSCFTPSASMVATILFDGGISKLFHQPLLIRSIYTRSNGISLTFWSISYIHSHSLSSAAWLNLSRVLTLLQS